MSAANLRQDKIEHLMKSIEVMGQVELVKIIQALIDRFGNDAVELVDQLTSNGITKEVLKVNKGTSVKTIASTPSTVNSIALYKAEKKEKNKKDFDMSRYRQRHIAIQIQYEGEPYYGFTTQTGGCEETVEKHIFEALLKLRLISDRHECQYSRCGRTDRGVSALGQTIALMVRSAIPLSVSAENLPKHPTDSIMVKMKKNKNIGTQKNDGKNMKFSKQKKSSEKNSDAVVEVGKKRKNLTESNEEYKPKKDSNKNVEEHTEDNLKKNEDCNGNENENKNKEEGGYRLKEIGTIDEIIEMEKEKEEGDEDGEEDEDEEKEFKEMDYCLMLNRVLPESIRALGWCEVTPEFSSRFSCSYRKYRYFFIKRNLNIKKMSEATSTLIGEHDFRNICKIDIAKVSNFKREIYTAKILPFQINMINDDLSVYMLEIQGIAFLWHMVRCIMSLLFMIGEGYENINIINILLDIENTPAKPHYKMAPELPLVLHECGFDNMKINYQPSVLWNLTTHYEESWSKLMIASARIKNALESLKSWQIRKSDVNDFIIYLTDKKKNIDDRKSGYKKDKNGGSKNNDSNNNNSNSCNEKGEKEEFNNLKKDVENNDVLGDSIINIPANSTKLTSNLDLGEYSNIKSKEHSGAIYLEGENMTWSAVLGLLEDQYGLSPMDSLLPHVPLTKRHTNDTYMDRRNQLTGNKKERLDRHLHLKETNAESDPTFFTKMRGQGTV